MKFDFSKIPTKAITGKIYPSSYQKSLSEMLYYGRDMELSLLGVELHKNPIINLTRHQRKLLIGFLNSSTDLIYIAKVSLLDFLDIDKKKKEEVKEEPKEEIIKPEDPVTTQEPKTDN